MNDFNTEIATSISKVTDKLESWLEAIILNLPNFALAIVIALLSYFIGNFVKRMVVKSFSKFTQNPTVLNLVGNITKVIIILITLFLILGIFDLNSTINKILATAGVVGLAIGLALQDPMVNLFSGVMMSVRNLYRIGDIVKTNDHMGTIKDISLRSTRLMTFSGEEVVIPNKDVIQNSLVNYSISGLRRVTITMGVSYGTDLEKVQEVVKNAIKGLDYHIQNKPVEVLYHSFGGSSIDFDVRFWHLFKSQVDYLNAKSNAIIAIKKAFDENDIVIPFPIRTLDFGIDGGVPLKEMLPDISEDHPSQVS